MIETYCTRRSYAAGDRVGLHVSIDASEFDVSIDREAKSRVVVHEQTTVAAPIIRSRPMWMPNGCGWPVATEMTIPYIAWRNNTA